MADLRIASPWMIYSREIAALFDRDSEVRVEFDNDTVELNIYVDSTPKAIALTALLPTVKAFGNVVMSINVIPANPVSINNATPKRATLDTFKTAFTGNGAISKFKHLEGMGMSIDYVVFKPEIVQYRADNIADLHGINSVLYQDIAYRVFEHLQYIGVFFCTDIANPVLKEETTKSPKFPKDEM